MLQRFKNGHNSKTRLGIRHPMWKGGKVKSSSGYILQWKPEHHFARRGKVFEHRLVWEEHYKACLLPWAHVHHRNSKRTDNRIENLEAMMASDHATLEQTKDMSDRVCNLCKSNETYNRKWYRIPNGYLCKTCGHRLRYEPARS